MQHDSGKSTIAEEMLERHVRNLTASNRREHDNFIMKVMRDLIHVTAGKLLQVDEALLADDMLHDTKILVAKERLESAKVWISTIDKLCDDAGFDGLSHILWCASDQKRIAIEQLNEC